MRHETTRQTNDALAATRRLRFRTAIHLATGDPILAFAEIDRAFEDTAAFGPAGMAAPLGGPAEWLMSMIEDCAAAARIVDLSVRPIVAPAPIAAVFDPDAGQICDHAANRAGLCSQEICLELPLAAAASAPETAEAAILALRRRGIRVSLDGRDPHDVHFSGSFWLLIDSLRVDPDLAFGQAGVGEMIERAKARGVSIIADHPRWRDAEALARIGVDYGLDPVADG